MMRSANLPEHSIKCLSGLRLIFDAEKFHCKCLSRTQDSAYINNGQLEVLMMKERSSEEYKSALTSVLDDINLS